MDADIENLTIVKNLTKQTVITKNINAICDYNKNFCLIRAFHGDLFLIWATLDNSLEVYDLNQEIAVDKIKAHDDWINSCHNFYDLSKEKDIVISCSDDKTIKVWEFKPLFKKENENEEYLTNILTIKQDSIGNFRNAFMFTDSEDNKNYILVELTDYAVAIFDDKGKYLKKFSECVFHDLWVDEHTNKTHLVTSYAGKVKFYEFTSGNISKEFPSESKLSSAAIVNNLLIIAEETKLRTLDIFNGEVLSEVKTGDNLITELTVWDLEYFFAGSADGTFTCYETKSLTSVKTLSNLGCEKVLYGSSFIHPRYGPALAVSGSINMEKGILFLLTLSDEGKMEIESGGMT